MMLLMPVAKSMIELVDSVNAPIPTEPFSDRPPVLNVPPLSVIVAPSLIRLVKALLPLSNKVPPELIAILDVPLIRPDDREFVLLISNMPPFALIVVGPV